MFFGIRWGFGEFFVEFVDEAGFRVVWEAGDEAPLWCVGGSVEEEERIAGGVPLCAEGWGAADVWGEEGEVFVEVAAGDSEVCLYCTCCVLLVVGAGL